MPAVAFMPLARRDTGNDGEGLAEVELYLSLCQDPAPWDDHTTLCILGKSPATVHFRLGKEHRIPWDGYDVPYYPC